MQRYFVEPGQLGDGQATILGDDAHHIYKVMRNQPGDEIIICDGQGECWLARLTQIAANQVTAELLEGLPAQAELPVQVTIAQGLPKADKLEWILQKGTELGAAAFLPFSSERTIVKLEPQKQQKKQLRWQKIVKEAAEQAHRSLLPQVLAPVSFAQLLQQLNQYTVCLLAYEQERQQSLRSAISTLAPGDHVLVMIGPEGGFSPQEAAQAVAAGAKPVSLGPRILRTETASQYVLAAISYQLEST